MIPNTTFYLLLDSAKTGDQIYIAKQSEPEFVSLFRGNSETELADVAPFLFVLKKDSELAKWYFENGFGNSWGMLIEAKIPLEELRHHLRKFLLVKTEEGQELYFRFYDPRVLNVFLPTCDENQITEVFEPIEKFYMEEEGKIFVNVYSQHNGKLTKSEIDAVQFKQMFLSVPEIENEKTKEVVVVDATAVKETIYKETEKDPAGIWWG